MSAKSLEEEENEGEMLRQSLGSSVGLDVGVVNEG